MEMMLHVFLVSALDRGRWSGLHSGRLISCAKITRFSYDRKLHGPGSLMGLGIMMSRAWKQTQTIRVIVTQMTPLPSSVVGYSSLLVSVVDSPQHAQYQRALVLLRIEFSVRMPAESSWLTKICLCFKVTTSFLTTRPLDQTLKFENLETQIYYLLI
jgi:hypothetical protein